MEPQLFTRGDGGDVVQGVDRPHVDRAGAADDKKRMPSGGAVDADLALQCLHVHLLGGVDRNAAQGVAAQSRHRHRARHRVVRRSRTVGDQRRAALAQAGLPVAGAQCGGQRDQQAHVVGHRRAGDEHAAGAVGKSEQFTHPAHDLCFDFEGHLVAPAHVGVQAAGEHVGQHADRGAAAVHPAHETRVGIADHVGQDVLHHAGMHALERTRLRRQCRMKQPARRRGDGLPYRPCTDVFDITEHVAQHLLRLRAKRGPIARVEVACHRVRSCHGYRPVRSKWCTPHHAATVPDRPRGAHTYNDLRLGQRSAYTWPFAQTRQACDSPYH